LAPPLERARGKVGDDGVERISTQSLFDLLEVTQRSRTAAAARRLAKIMRELGWAPIAGLGTYKGARTDAGRLHRPGERLRQNKDPRRHAIAVTVRNIAP
jgi:hypothetical protein